MAALVCIALSVGVQFYRAGCVFIATGGSVVDAYNYLRDTRNEILERRYLDNLDSVYGTQNYLIDSSKKVNSRCTFQQANKGAMDDDIKDGYDFIEIERAMEAYENESRDVSVNIMQLKRAKMLVVSRDRKNTANGCITGIIPKFTYDATQFTMLKWILVGHLTFQLFTILWVVYASRFRLYAH